ncbi:MAG: putative membrane protein [Oceanospirillaceae bacterium]
MLSIKNIKNRSLLELNSTFIDVEVDLQRSKKDLISLFSKGCMMGAADAVPGVSGGTIAFITGIYQELIQSLSRLGPKAIQILYKKGFSQAWLYVNGNFLAILLLGMLTSILLLSNLVLFLLQNQPQMLWGFFFGLICASTVLLAKTITHWDKFSVLFFILGSVGSYILTTLGASVLEVSNTNVFFAGMLAICAMILPGISGSFILLLLGLYSHILGSIKSLDLMTLAVFAGGCISGLLCFSKVLNWLFSCYKNITVALLTGFLFGSLNKVWPWKETLTTRVNSHGLQVADLQQNISPFNYQQVTGVESQFFMVCILALLAVVVVLALEKMNNV